MEAAKKARVRALLNHPDTEICLLAERSFLRTLQGGCSVPVFGLATLHQNTLSMTGGVVSLDGQQLLRMNATLGVDTLQTPITLGQNIALDLIKQGANKILENIRQS
ncbi:MAG: hypothetical protein EAZ80_00690 [Runella slithyformis]|nr:MAG: hypothetical protein EAZ80_00690 [Runella slithyformis]